MSLLFVIKTHKKTLLDYSNLKEKNVMVAADGICPLATSRYCCCHYLSAKEWNTGRGSLDQPIFHCLTFDGVISTAEAGDSFSIL